MKTQKTDLICKNINIILLQYNYIVILSPVKLTLLTLLILLMTSSSNRSNNLEGR